MELTGNDGARLILPSEIITKNQLRGTDPGSK
jgi:hypothetical protein